MPISRGIPSIAGTALRLLAMGALILSAGCALDPSTKVAAGERAHL